MLLPVGGMVFPEYVGPRLIVCQFSRDSRSNGDQILFVRMQQIVEVHMEATIVGAGMLEYGDAAPRIELRDPLRFLE